LKISFIIATKQSPVVIMYGVCYCWTIRYQCHWKSQLHV